MRWQALCATADVRSSPVERFDHLARHYSEPQRAYHNTRHIDECLAEFDSVRADAAHPIALELAIWFHDVIYDPRANDNEEQSAAFSTLQLQEISDDLARHVSDLILATKTHLPGEVQDAELLIDIDLSILGKPAPRFAEYEAAIRSEYAWVPNNIYSVKRREILRAFLNRGRIYITKVFHDHYETAARQNISELIAELESSH